MKSSLPLLLSLLLLTSCHTSHTASSGTMRSLVKAGITLGFDIEATDNHALMLEAARWVGTPYRAAGDTRRGVDCSGLTCAIVREVYDVRLPRSSSEQFESTMTHHVTKRAAREGDLVFFSTERSRRGCGHVGILLKDDRFIHASTSRGVIVSSLNEAYYKKHYLGARRIKR